MNEREQMSAMGLSTMSLLVAFAAVALVVYLAFVIGCRVEPDIREIQEALCERLESTPDGYRDCLQELQR